MSKKFDLSRKKNIKNFSEDDDKHDRIVHILDEKYNIDTLKKLDEKNPMEQAIKYDAVKSNPPRKGFMKVDVFESTDNDGNPIAVSKSKGFDGKEQEVKHYPIMSVDLNTLIAADIAACPSNVMPMLLDEYQLLAVNEKRKFKPEKRKDEFNWWWIVFFLLMIPGIIFVILLFL